MKIYLEAFHLHAAHLAFPKIRCIMKGLISIKITYAETSRSIFLDMLKLHDSSKWMHSRMFSVSTFGPISREAALYTRDAALKKSHADHETLDW